MENRTFKVQLGGCYTEESGFLSGPFTADAPPPTALVLKPGEAVKGGAKEVDSDDEEMEDDE